jgi:hypothetical protein
MPSRGLTNRVTDADRERNRVLCVGNGVVPRASGWPDNDHAPDRELHLPDERLHVGGDRR